MTDKEFGASLGEIFMTFMTRADTYGKQALKRADEVIHITQMDFDPEGIAAEFNLMAAARKYIQIKMGAKK